MSKAALLQRPNRAPYTPIKRPSSARAAAALVGVASGETTFTAEFEQRVHAIEERLRALNLNWTWLCSQAQISRTTPDRWKKQEPLTVQLVDRLGRILSKREQEQAKLLARVKADAAPKKTKSKRKSPA